MKSRRKKLMQIYSLHFLVANYTCFQIGISFDIYLHFENQHFFHLDVLGWPLVKMAVTIIEEGNVLVFSLRTICW
jgi:hypothetical protein